MRMYINVTCEEISKSVKLKAIMWMFRFLSFVM